MTERNYKSKITGNNCSEAQYIVELLMLRQAEKQNTYLPSKFWNLPEWEREYKKQIVKAHFYLKKYSAEIIIQTLTEKRNRWIYSLYYKKLDMFFKTKQIKINKQNKQTNIKYTDNTKSIPVKKGKKQSKINKIRDIE